MIQKLSAINVPNPELSKIFQIIVDCFSGRNNINGFFCKKNIIQATMNPGNNLNAVIQI